MLGIEKLDQAIEKYLGEITEEQEAVLRTALDHPVTEKELFERLGVEEDAFGKFMQSFHYALSEEGKAEEKAVFAQEVSQEELENVSGGAGTGCWSNGRRSCLAQLYRNMYDDFYTGAGFPNCANTVNDGSWCGENDACFSMAIIYEDMTDCHKAWR